MSSPENPPRRRSQHRVGGESMTKQADAAAADVNTLMRKYVQTGVVPGSGKAPRYGDFSSGLSFHESLEAIRAAEEEFAALPSAVRRLCDNDPGKFLDLVFEPSGEGFQKLVEVGFAPELAPEKPAEPVQVSIVNPEPAAGGQAEGGSE